MYNDKLFKALKKKKKKKKKKTEDNIIKGERNLFRLKK